MALDPRWTVTLTSPAAARPGFDQQFAYVPVEGGQLLAITLDAGRVVWALDIATPTTPATGDGLVFVAVEGAIVALDQQTGRQLWRLDVETLAAPLFWDSGWLFVSTTSGELLALNATDGQVRWRQALKSPLKVAPSVANDRVYLALQDGRVLALDLESGATRWTLALGQDVTGVLALEDQLLLGTRANLLHSLALDNGRIRWSQKAGADVIGAPLADERHIYFVAYDNVLRALNRRTGNLQWRRNLPSRPSGGALRVDDVVLVPFSTNDIGAYEAATGAPAFTIQAVGELAGAPFLRDNPRPTAPRLIAISREGALQGFAPRIEPPPAPLTDLPGAAVAKGQD